MPLLSPQALFSQCLVPPGKAKSGGNRRKGVVEALEDLIDSRWGIFHKFLSYDEGLSQRSKSLRVFLKVFIHNAHVMDTNMPDLKSNTYQINILLNGGKIYLTYAASISRACLSIMIPSRLWILVMSFTTFLWCFSNRVWSNGNRILTTTGLLLKEDFLHSM